MLEKIVYKGWANCYRLSNDLIELVFTGDVGPRIIFLGLKGKENLLHVNSADFGKTGGIQWRHYSGHRLWYGPEQKPRTYYPDNVPIQVKEEGNVVHLIQPVEETTGIQKEIDLLIDPITAHVKVVHRVRNTTLWPIKEIAIWALSDVADGGVEIMPLPERIIHDPDVFPSPHPLILWDYTDMSDPRWTWGNRFILLRDSKLIPSHQKAGMKVPAGWVAYAVNNQLFVKKFTTILNLDYPDGCSAVLFTNGGQSQLESKGPVTCLDSQATMEHIEDWYLFDNVQMPQNDQDVEEFILPNIQTIS